MYGFVLGSLSHILPPTGGIVKTHIHPLTGVINSSPSPVAPWSYKFRCGLIKNTADILALRYPHTCEYVFFHLRENLSSKILTSVVALHPIIPYVKTKKG